jgi:hypothetical protein
LARDTRQHRVSPEVLEAFASRRSWPARRLARLSKHGAGSVTRWGSVAVLGLLSADMERAREFASRELGPLDADDDAMARLRATLAVEFEAALLLREPMAISLAVAPPEER